MTWPLVGQEPLRERLEHELGRRRLHHGLLLTGPAGCGKRTLAHALAAALLCETGVPLGCGACGSCQRARRGLHADVHVLRRPAGKTQIPVEQVRSLLEDFGRAELEGHGRVAILEDVDQLGREGQNALLKTLEEPWPRRWLIATTSRPELLLDTVRSRVQRVPVPALPPAVLAAQLVAEFGLDDSAAARLAQLAQGSLGEARRLHAEGAGTWERRLAPLLAPEYARGAGADAGGATRWLAGLFDELDAEEEGLRQAKRLRAERALGLALVFERERAHAELEQGTGASGWDRIEELLAARARLDAGLAPDLVLRELWDRLARS